MKVRYKKGEICYRCGIEKKEAREYKMPCGVMGQLASRHIWNDKPMTVEVLKMKFK